MAIPIVEIPRINEPFTGPQVSIDPAAVLNPIRELGPVVYNEAYDEYAVTTFAANAEALEDPTRFDVSTLVDTHQHLFGSLTLNSVNDRTRHSELRGVWAKSFRRESVTELRDMIESVLDRELQPWIDRVRSGETVEAVQVMRTIPTLVIAHMLAIDPDVFDEFSAWSEAQMAMVNRGMDDSPEGRQCVADGIAATKAMNVQAGIEIERRRVTPGPDLITMIATADLGLPEEELIGNVTQLIVAGHETTSRFLGHALVTLANHPVQRALVQKDRSLMLAAFEEIMRYETIVNWLSRGVVEDTELAGVPVPAGATLRLLLGAANRDPARWENPDVFDITRPFMRNLGFGSGMHLCLGANLARFEAACVLERLLDQIPDWQLAGPADYGRTFATRGPEQVMIAI